MNINLERVQKVTADLGADKNGQKTLIEVEGSRIIGLEGAFLPTGEPILTVMYLNPEGKPRVITCNARNLTVEI